MVKLKIAVLISGRGSNLQSLIEACQQQGYPAEIVQVVSNVDGVMGIARAERAGIPATVIEHRSFTGREAFEQALGEVIEQSGAELICLAGFMRLLTAQFVRRWHDRMINIHPSLLPAFKGLNVHQRAIDAGVRFSGCTVHFVRPDMDCGPIIAQAAAPINAGDDSSALAARILEQEHVIYPLAVKMIAEGRVRVDNERVDISGASYPENSLVSPQPY